jgi:hypothetical protein
VALASAAEDYVAFAGRFSSTGHGLPLHHAPSTKRVAEIVGVVGGAFSPALEIHSVLAVVLGQDNPTTAKGGAYTSERQLLRFATATVLSAANATEGGVTFSTTTGHEFS